VSRDFLPLQLRLLISVYGRNKVLQALAIADDSPIDNIIADINSLQVSKKKPKREKGADEIISSIVTNHPSRDLLEKLAVRFENKTFLPDLHQVNDFLERHGAIRTMRLRKKALRPLLELLSKWTPERLASLLEESASRESSTDYALLANEIMASPRQRRDADVSKQK